MEPLMGLLILFSTQLFIQSAPIKNGFAVKFNPISSNEEVAPKTFGSLFAKIPQEFKVKDQLRKGLLSKVFFPYSAELGTGCTNQIAKLKFPMQKRNSGNLSIPWHTLSPTNLPIIKQPYENYKIVVATAPPNVKLDGKAFVVYVVFPDEKSNISSHFDMPKILFVNERNIRKGGLERKEHAEPIFIVDSNRTVTGLKSNAVAKFVKFKSKLPRRYDYMVKR